MVSRKVLRFNGGQIASNAGMPFNLNDYVSTPRHVVDSAVRGCVHSQSILFANLFEVSRRAILSFQISLHSAEDVIQEALTTFFVSGLTKYVGSRPIEAYYLGYLRQTLRKHYRSNRESVASVNHLLHDPQKPESSLESSGLLADEIIKTVKATCEDFHAWEIAAIEMFLSGDSYADIAEALGKDPRQVSRLVTEKFYFQVVKYWATQQDISDRIAPFVSQATMCRRNVGNIRWPIRVMDLLLHGLRDRMMKGSVTSAEAEVMLPAWKLRINLALDSNQLSSADNLIREADELCKAMRSSRQLQAGSQIEHLRARRHHNANDHATALKHYQIAIAGLDDGSCLRDIGSVLCTLRVFDESRAFLRQASRWWREKGNDFQAKRCDSLNSWTLAQAGIELRNERLLSTAREDLSELQSSTPEFCPDKNPAAYVQHSMNHLDALAGNFKDHDAASELAMKLLRIIELNHYRLQHFNLVETCMSHDALRWLLPKLSRPCWSRHVVRRPPAKDT